MVESSLQPPTPFGPPVVEVHLCVPEDQTRFLPKRRRAPDQLPPNMPVPRVGEIVYLSTRSAWSVYLVAYEWLSPMRARVEVWLVHVTSDRTQRPTGFALTQ